MQPTNPRPRYITVPEAQRVWSEVRTEVPLGDGRIKHGTLAMAGYWTGSFTQVQLDEFERRTRKMIRAAKKAARQAVAA